MLSGNATAVFIAQKQQQRLVKKSTHTSELHKSALLTITKQLQRSKWIFVYIRVLLAAAQTHTTTHIQRHTRCEFVIVLLCSPLSVAFRVWPNLSNNCTKTLTNNMRNHKIYVYAVSFSLIKYFTKICSCFCFFPCVIFSTNFSIERTKANKTRKRTRLRISSKFVACYTAKLIISE